MLEETNSNRELVEMPFKYGEFGLARKKRGRIKNRTDLFS